MPSETTNIYWCGSSSPTDASVFYVMRDKTRRGDTVCMCLHRYEDYPSNRYFVSMYIGKRGNGYVTGKQTGRSGIEGLLIARDMLSELMKCMYDGEELYIYADDERRWNVYKKYLTPLGFVSYDRCVKCERHLVYVKKCD